MRVSEARVGRVFVMRLEDGDRLPEAVEAFARQSGVSRGVCFLVGGIGGGRVVVGPERSEARPVIPMVRELDGVHEAAAVGTLFPDEDGVPRLHMHAALGRGDDTRTGCVRTGIEVWELGELVLVEILESGAVRRRDPDTGFLVLDVSG